jgi:hypothetical protein
MSNSKLVCSPNSDVAGTTHVLKRGDAVIGRLYVDGSPAWRDDATALVQLASEADMLREERDALKRRVDELETLLDQAEENNAARPYGRGAG